MSTLRSSVSVQSPDTPLPQSSRRKEPAFKLNLSDVASEAQGDCDVIINVNHNSEN